MVGGEDYALQRVPRQARYRWWLVAVQWVGQLSDLTQFLTGAALGAGLAFPDAILAFALGSAVLEIVAILVGIAGCREGLSTSVLARWTGFGRYGSALIAVVIAISSIGWFGVQNQIFAEGLERLLGTMPVWGWSLVTGIGITVLVMYGFRWMGWVAYLTVPAFLLLAGYSVVSVLSGHDLGALAASQPFGEPLTVASGATIVAGSYIVGAVVAPDMTRFNRKPADVVKQSVLSITVGEFLMGLIGVLLAYAIKQTSVVDIFAATTGVLGVLIVVSATVKINDWNLYSASLGFVNALSTLFGLKVGRVPTTIVIGALGTVLSALGILSHFVDFLTLLGVCLPPIAGITVAEYYLVRRWRPHLDAGREAGRMPETEPGWVPAAVLVWAVAAAVGWWSSQAEFGIPSLNSLLVGLLGYWLAGALKLAGGTGERTAVTR
ncbi:cytosine permease [Kutzneria viridogrisea]|uniref:Cytosine permease n=2 Tax=Kutzneria TaxID=43356 RepID=W5WFL0_9PSEU|nr:cytosine permease [Kutzneria albida]AHH99988.1 hypothetical protein KALB_6629 [Kutzneria albida DSM 43870]MBA8925168.1 cytosine permease [Kutzneria viridogrisea]